MVESVESGRQTNRQKLSLLAAALLSAYCAIVMVVASIKVSDNGVGRFSLIPVRDIPAIAIPIALASIAISIICLGAAIKNERGRTLLTAVWAAVLLVGLLAGGAMFATVPHATVSESKLVQGSFLERRLFHGAADVLGGGFDDLVVYRTWVWKAALWSFAALSVLAAINLALSIREARRAS